MVEESDPDIFRRELAFTYMQLRNSEINRRDAIQNLLNAWLEFASLNYGGNPVDMYLLDDYTHSKLIIDMCIRNNPNEDNDLHVVHAFNLTYAHDHYYIQLDTIKSLQTRIEQLQALIDLS